jgi:hypothetical protein
MNTIAGVLSPALLAAFAGVTLGVGAILFVMNRRSEGAAIDFGVPLSWAEPIEVRLVLYLILGATCGTCALMLRLLLGFLSVTSLVLGWLLIAGIVVGFLLNLAFFYAAAGTLLQAALGTMGRPPYWFSGLLSFLDGRIMDVGDAMGGVLFRPPPVRERRVKRRKPAYDDYEYETDAPVRERRARRVVYEDQDERESEYAAPARREPAVERVERRRATRPSVLSDEYAVDAGEYAPPGGDGFPRTARREPEVERVERRRATRPSVVSDEYGVDAGEYAPPGGDGFARTARREPAAPATRPMRYRPVYADYDDEQIVRSPIADESTDYLDDVEQEESPRPGGRRARGGPPRDLPRERLELAIREYEAALTPTQKERLREMRSLVESVKLYA